MNWSAGLRPGSPTTLAKRRARPKLSIGFMVAMRPKAVRASMNRTVRRVRPATAPPKSSRRDWRASLSTDGGHVTMPP